MPVCPTDQKFIWVLNHAVPGRPSPRPKEPRPGQVLLSSRAPEIPDQNGHKAAKPRQYCCLTHWYGRCTIAAAWENHAEFVTCRHVFRVSAEGELFTRTKLAEQLLPGRTTQHSLEDVYAHNIDRRQSFIVPIPDPKRGARTNLHRNHRRSRRGQYRRRRTWRLRDTDLNRDRSGTPNADQRPRSVQCAIPAPGQLQRLCDGTRIRGTNDLGDKFASGSDSESTRRIEGRVGQPNSLGHRSFTFVRPGHVLSRAGDQQQ